MQQFSSIHWMKSLRGTLLVFVIIFTPLYSSMRPVPVSAASFYSCPQGKSCIFLPNISSRTISGDLALSGVEVTQAVQDTQNSVPLVAGRTTALRIFAISGAGAGTGAPAQTINGVQVSVTATRGGITLSNSPATFQSSVPLSNSRADYNSTVNMILPADWLSGTIDLTVRLDPDNLLVEPDETNNSMTLRLTFNPVPVLQIKIIPIRYTHTPNGRTYSAPTQDTISNWMYRIFPVNRIDVSWHMPYTFTGNLGNVNDWQRLLDEVTSLKYSEGAPSSQIYYGLIPTSDGNSSWFSGGIAGIAWIGSRASVGLNTPTAAQIAAHEVGHNLGVWHAPCGCSAGVDPAFPYANGSIGTYGLDVTTGTVYSPDYNRDLMSYCNPKWISDYTYRNLYMGQVRNGGSQNMTLSSSKNSSQRSLLVRAQLDGQQTNLLPAYILSGQADEYHQEGQYVVQMYDLYDNILSEFPVKEEYFDVEGEVKSAINSLVPLPDEPVAKIRLVKDGTVLAEQVLQTNMVAPKTLVEESQTGGNALVRWGNQTNPVMVRFSSDGGLTWTTLGIDLEGGEFPVNSTMLSEQGGMFEVLTANTWNE